MNGRKHVNYKIGEEVVAKDYRDMSKIVFIGAIVLKKIGKCTYLVEVPELNVKWKRHANQLRLHNKKYVISSIPLTLNSSTYSEDVNQNVNLEDNDSEVSGKTESVLENTNSNNDTVNKRVTPEKCHETVINRPKRIIKPVERLVYK